MNHEPCAEGLLLCEACGYRIDGLDARGACPECGRAIGLSLPARRGGTPAQRPWRRRGWSQTLRLMLLRPQAAFEKMRADPQGDRRLQRRAILLASVLHAVPGAVSYVLWRVIEHPFSAASWPIFVLGAVLLAVIASGGLVLALSLMTWMEQWGSGLLARRRRWRIDPPVARAICAHASAGWVAGGLLACVLAAAWTPLALLLPWPRAWGPSASGLALLAGQGVAFVAGLMWFEVLAYLGVLRCRFANVPRAAAGGSA